MKKNDLAVIKGLNANELTQKVRDYRKELTNLHLDKNMKKLKDLRVVFKKRKDMAQVLTVLRQKQMLAELESREEKKQ